MTSPRTILTTLLGVLALAACDDPVGPLASPDADLAAAAAVAASHAASPDLTSAPGVVFTSTNQTDGNELLVYTRRADGSLAAAGRLDTGGYGTGGGLGNQGAVTLTHDGRRLLVVNAGSDDVSVFDVGRTVDLRSTTPSRGTRPISVAVHGDLVYVLNGGGSENVAGFRLRRSGELLPIDGAVYGLSQAGVASAQVGFSPDGRALVVTEKATNRIVSYPVGRDGRLGPPAVTGSAGQTPFGFAFNRQGALVVSEAFGGAAGASVVSSYRLHRDGGLQVISPAVATTQTAACWIVISENGRYAYASNTGSGTISLYGLTPAGDLHLIEGAAAEEEGSAPIDMALSQGGRFLYVLNAGTGSIGAYRVDGRGGLAPLDETAGLPGGTTGLAAR